MKKNESMLLVLRRAKQSDFVHYSLKCLHHVERLNVKFSVFNHSVEIINAVKIAQMRLSIFQEIHSFAAIKAGCNVWADCRRRTGFWKSSGPLAECTNTGAAVDDNFFATLNVAYSADIVNTAAYFGIFCSWFKISFM
jgi:hypothetical protein